jgi:23S rRNA pseudouridine955/2504/2580 synthase
VARSILAEACKTKIYMSTEAQINPQARTAVRSLTMGEEEAGQRVDRVLARLLPGVPHTRLFRLLRRGEVRVNGKRVSGETRITAGDVLRVPPVRLEPPPAIAPEAAPRVSNALIGKLNAAVLYEDERLLVIDKPAGVAVHGGSGVSAGVIEALRAARPEEPLELVHRLDRDTSGCLMIARRRSTLRSMHAMLREDAFDKRYLVLVRGKWELGKKLIDAPLRTDLRVGGERTVKVAPDGKASATEFRVVQFFGQLATLLEAKLLSGRTHQIRVHAAYAGHVVAGDEKYGDEEFNEQLRAFGLRRLFLHAHSVGFEDPERHVAMSISAPLPDALRSVLDALTARAGRLKPSGTKPTPQLLPARATPAIKPSLRYRERPRKAKSAAARPAPSGRVSRSPRTGSRRGPRS